MQNKDFRAVLAAGVLGLSLFLGSHSGVMAGSGEVEGEPGDMSVEEAVDNFKEDAGALGDKASEVGSDIADEAEDAYDSAKESVEEATE
ncbi:MAG: hypothetical protein AAF530_12070 [Pseudomonadota bacterium]